MVKGYVAVESVLGLVGGGSRAKAKQRHDAKEGTHEGIDTHLRI